MFRWLVCSCDVHVDVMCFACALLHLESDMSNAVMLWLVLNWSGTR